MMQFPKILPSHPETYNRKYRRALKVIGRYVAVPAYKTSQLRFARISALIGKPAARADKMGHYQLVTAFMVAL